MSAFKILPGTSAGNRPLGRPRRRGGIIRVGITEVGVNMRNWIESAQDY